ncbi:putative N-acetyl-LL-diaminopimelate aminotransferase [Desulfosporosinus acididurans]|uniref:Putative N-acetyl-LL-diaminopimelate aminotransferase n=1 Tax=Desulfosporosinus acididurans TaxID=476652 RepID=A0A0J1FPL7_9FIRM|nr:aminotransferase class I/II-fold pyridoxal phosphate-dependent enzyme [Desulfosporosinus acididurans]KLU65439.1 putative N-acetyl-LL-diaminopimelate aminotransferase [Desulfosporosinus acididurans]
MNEIAQELNDRIKKENPHVYELLSDLGRNMYYPKGILTQTAEAKQKAHRFDATIGIATEGNQPMFLPVIHDTLSDYDPKNLYPYAPPAGKPELRQLWQKKMLQENPSLKNKSFSNPIVTNALTHGLSIAADLFMNENDPLILPDKLWGNYNLIFGVRRGAKSVTFPFYNERGSFNSQGLKKAILSKKEHGKAVVLLNFPNNPTGYTPNEKEAAEIIDVLKEVAQEGMNLVVLTDDAYFGLFYEDSIKESLFARIANIHPRILAIKVDGATKEEFVWGFRVGFITFASESPAILDALENKALGSIRGAISSASHPAQSFVLHALQSSEFQTQKKQKFELLKSRATKVKEILSQGSYDDAWDYYPFNSGYFMCMKLKHGVNAEALRLHLLDHYGIGVISLGESDVRVAFSCVEVQDLKQLFDLVYQGFQDLKGQ